MNANKASLATAALCGLLLAFATPSIAQTIKTKISLESAAAPGKIQHDAPCFIVYPEGEDLLLLVRSGLKTQIEQSLSQKGYQIVANPDDAAIFVKVVFAALPPFEANVTVKGRDTWDYSNAASTRNYAAIMMGGRYSELADPERNRDTQNVSAMLGPSGEVIDPTDQKNIEATVAPGKTKQATLVIHPLAFQISGWQFDEAKPDADPTNLWQVTASLESPAGESIESRLADLADAAIKQIGKPLKKTKFLPRKPAPSTKSEKEQKEEKS